ncbi:20S cyclosome subunit (APC1/BimE), putative [Metarhizium acridum CQMa 102]|uniref:20S cyclosome subunit (APC1/BimE), putative n=1 Tax=Metarhizium acridum (strain CQMa 102) TaxID=655827 RepID=E9EHY5_METAQ|nr:20S cyclosome subunit (APC1/BimE), putative [Metarhizium acridum CQMa 102]EFY84476.1 20S cyclosome subunit (APC1/BimE), putative [Metarhizium acridum CQMa 102]
MASVRSLGLHHPSGLRHAIEEQLLPQNPPPSAYNWEITSDEKGDEAQEDELLTTGNCVVWCRGGIFRKTFKFGHEKEPVTQALLAYFATSEDALHIGNHNNGTPTKAAAPAAPKLEKALVVFLKTQAHVFFLSGTSHIIHMPFEVESACAGPIGVVIQRKHKAENLAPIALKFPRVPPNSFVSSQLTALNSSQQTAFSVEGLGKPKSLYFGLSSTLETMWDMPSEQQQLSHWPRLVSLMDPLSDIGLVVAEPEPHSRRPARQNKSTKPAFLDPAEEILHIEQINLPGSDCRAFDTPLILAVTMNRENGSYTVWRLKYLEHEDPFIGQQKKAKNKTARRRSSMPPQGFTSGTSTPVQQNFRESFGAPLPGKRQRKSEKVEKPLDLVSSLEQQDNEGAGITRRSSRRLSSMLARADLSASHERSVFADQPLTSNTGASKRIEHNGHHGRSSSSFHLIHPSLGSLLEAPLDAALDEGLHNMGLDDHDFDGLQSEIRFTKIQTIALDSSNVRYSTSTLPARCQTKVFIVTAPPFVVDEQGRTQLLIGIQEPLEKRLQMMTLHVKAQEKPDLATTTSGKDRSRYSIVSISSGTQWKVQSVVDSSKLVDGDLSVILVLSDSDEGHHELTAQAPWIELTKIPLSLLFVDDTRNIQYRGRVADRDVKQRKSEVMDLSSGGIVGIRHPRNCGIVDVVDTRGRLHQLGIQLQPSCPQVKKVLNICKSVLPDALGGRLHACWLHVAQWLQNHQDNLPNVEWSATSVLLLSSFLNLGREDNSPLKAAQLAVRKRRPVSGSFGAIRESEDWRALELGETTNSLGCPVWMMNQGWQWALEEEPADNASAQSDALLSPKFLTRHIALSKEYLSSPLGEAAMGRQGYMPVSLARSSATRRQVAVDIFMALHLLLDEQKLDITTPEYVSPGRTDLRVLLCQLARWLKWQSFVTIYELGIQEDVDSRHDSELNLRPAIPQPPVRPDIFEWIQSRLSGVRGKPCMTPADIYYASSRVSEAEKLQDKRWDAITTRTLMFKRFFKIIRPKSTAVEMVEAMQDCGFTNFILETLPEAVLAPLQDAISLCQPHPPSQWPHHLLDLVRRSDISLIVKPSRRPRQPVANILAPTHMAAWDFKMLCQSVEEANNTGYDEGEGTERQAVIRALFKDDRRLNEAQDLLSTHKARVVRLNPDPSWPESEYLEKQKELVSRIAMGTLAIPAGRALLYYSLRFPLITQKFHIGGFNLNCIVKPTNVTVGVDKSLFTEEKVCWGFFHQGVAAGLAISPQAKGIDTSWILYNKPAQELSNRHAGFLLALGLNGHLKGVAKWVAFKYLTPKHTMTSIGLLLGLAASYMGTMDSLITRLLSVHATRMLPRGAAELNLSPLTQTSGIMGIGLLYCNSQHRRMSEIMLSEIEHIDEEDEEEPLRSECYRLAAGFALGLINLGKGGDLKGLQDMKLTEKLIAHATATKNVEIVHILDRASAGAVVAIALIFMKSEDQIVARKIDVPDSVLQFDYVRPDILLLRTVAKNLILWSKIEPTLAWVRDSLPLPYRARHKLQGTTKLRSTDLPFFSILTGICFSIALRFSGSASTRARDLLLHYLDQFIRISNIEATPRPHSDAAPLYDEELARSNARMCQDILALSCSIVMAGTGDILVLRRLRSLHGRDNPDIPYGSHLAAHLAIGSLFLGCGTVTFGSSNKAIAALLISFYPIFPSNVMDNRSHLQALRHFWVLATEQRCLVAKDVLTGQPVSVSVQIKKKQDSSSEHILYRTTPCLLPPLDQISSLSTSCGPRFWDIELDFSNDELRQAFAQTQSIYLQRRPPSEGAFTSTLRTLGSDGKGNNPLEWIFGLGKLRSVSYAERAALMESNEKEQDAGSAVDARMEMERGIAQGGDRERLEGARLLFEWGAARERLLKSAVPSAQDSQATIKPSDSQETMGEHVTPHAPGGDVWWMRDSAIEALKGQVWLAVRDGDV